MKREPQNWTWGQGRLWAYGMMKDAHPEAALTPCLCGSSVCLSSSVPRSAWTERSKVILAGRLFVVFSSCLCTHAGTTFLPPQDLVNESSNKLVIKAWLCKEKRPSHVPVPRPAGQNSRRSWRTFKWQSSKLHCQSSWVFQHDHEEAIESDSDVCRVIFGHCSCSLTYKMW